MGKLVFGIICVFISFNVFSFTKVIEANGEEQIHILKGKDGRNGSNVHCTQNGPRRRGKDGADGEDAGTVLIKYNKLEDLKLIKIVSNPGKGGHGGKGCNGGGRGHSGQNGQHALVYLYNLNLGIDFNDDLITKEIQTRDINQNLKLSKNIWEKKININEVLAPDSNPQNNYLSFLKRKELLAKILVTNEMNLENAKLEVSYDYQNDDVKIRSLRNSLLLLKKELLDDTVTFTIENIFSENELFGFDGYREGKKENLKLVLSPFEDVFSNGIEIEASILVYTHGVWGNEIQKKIKLKEDRIQFENGKLILNLSDLDLEQYKTFLKRDFLGVDLTFKANLNTIHNTKYLDIKF